MNQQMLELAKESEWLANRGDDVDVVAMMEKFGEMIVKECIDTVADCSIEYCTRPQIVSEIKEHFGVE